MKQEFEELYHQLEIEHFWFKSRRGYIAELLREENKDIKVLDIGCSSGILLTELIQQGFNPKNLYGIDISEKAILLSKKQGLQNTYVMDAQHINLPDKFDVIIASDCLEHLENDIEALKNWKSLLKANGRCHIFVPAYMSLWSSHDVANMHFRRYTLKTLRSALEKADLKLNYSTYWNFFLFIPIFFVRIFSRLSRNNKQASGDLNQITPYNRILLAILSFENRILRHIKFPFGVSLYCCVVKS